MSEGKKRVAVLASGRGSNLQAIIDRLPQLPIELVLVVSDRPEAHALARARNAGIETAVIEPRKEAAAEFEPALLTALKEKKVEIIVLAGFMRLLGNSFLSQAPGPVINIHPSLLPSFPGLDAQTQALNYGVKVSGCTVHFVDEGMDTGPIIAQRVVPVLASDTEETLAARILEQEHLLLPRVIELLAQDRIVLENKKVVIRGEY